MATSIDIAMASAAMSLSSVSVILNALRLRNLNLHEKTHWGP